MAEPWVGYFTSARSRPCRRACLHVRADRRRARSLRAKRGDARWEAAREGAPVAETWVGYSTGLGSTLGRVIHLSIPSYRFCRTRSCNGQKGRAHVKARAVVMKHSRSLGEVVRDPADNHARGPVPPIRNQRPLAHHKFQRFDDYVGRSLRQVLSARRIQAIGGRKIQKKAIERVSRCLSRVQDESCK